MTKVTFLEKVKIRKGFERINMEESKKYQKIFEEEIKRQKKRQITWVGKEKVILQSTLFSVMALKDNMI